MTYVNISAEKLLFVVNFRHLLVHINVLDSARHKLGNRKNFKFVDALFGGLVDGIERNHLVDCGILQSFDSGS